MFVNSNRFRSIFVKIANIDTLSKSAMFKRNYFLKSEPQKLQTFTNSSFQQRLNNLLYQISSQLLTTIMDQINQELNELLSIVYYSLNSVQTMNNSSHFRSNPSNSNQSGQSLVIIIYWTSFKFSI